MNWEMLCEKLSKDGKKITIFCAKEDREDAFVVEKVKKYQAKGHEVVVRNAEPKIVKEK